MGNLNQINEYPNNSSSLDQIIAYIQVGGPDFFDSLPPDIDELVLDTNGLKSYFSDTEILA